MSVGSVRTSPEACSSPLPSALVFQPLKILPGWEKAPFAAMAASIDATVALRSGLFAETV